MTVRIKVRDTIITRTISKKEFDDMVLSNIRASTALSNKRVYKITKEHTNMLKDII